MVILNGNGCRNMFEGVNGNLLPPGQLGLNLSLKEGPGPKPRSFGYCEDVDIHGDRIGL